MIDPYASGVLTRDRHGRLVANMERYAKDAGIPVSWLWTPATGHVTAPEQAWLVGFRQHKLKHRAGLILHGKQPKIPIETRMSAMVAVLTRNYVHARLMTLNQVLESLRDGQPPMMHGLFIPNFYVPNTASAHEQVQEWRVAPIYDLLLARQQAGLQTVLYATGLKELGVAYGGSVHSHIKAFYDAVEA